VHLPKSLPIALRALQMKSVITTILPCLRFLRTAAPVTYNPSLTLFVKDGLFVRVARR